MLDPQMKVYHSISMSSSFPLFEVHFPNPMQVAVETSGYDSIHSYRSKINQPGKDQPLGRRNGANYRSLLIRKSLPVRSEDNAIRGRPKAALLDMRRRRRRRSRRCRRRLLFN